VNSSGQLGTASSSKRFKEEISDMGESSSRLMALRPVTFRYKSEIDREERPLQYGLIAEEVAEVYPDLVQFKKDGEPFSVRYHELSPMLLNEAQRQYRHIQEQDEHIRELKQGLNEKEVRIQKLEKLLEAVQERVTLIESPKSK
jgi:predicted RNase H-like nuclease (RuvC/YqgF family)